MKALFRTCAAVALAAVSSLGAAKDVVARDYNWTGIYLGGHVGGMSSGVDWTHFDGVVSEGFSHSGSSLTAGGHIGGLYQINSIVIGAELSWAVLDHDKTTAAVLAADSSRTSRLDDLFMATVRFGLALDRWQPYVKAGYASSDASFDTFVTSTGQRVSQSNGRDHGYTLGTGLEYGLTSTIMLGIQYDYVRLDIGDRTQSVTAGFATPQTVTEASADIHSVTARLSLKFGGDSGPQYRPLK